MIHADHIVSDVKLEEIMCSGPLLVVLRAIFVNNKIFENCTSVLIFEWTRKLEVNWT